MTAERILFVTGRLAEPALRRVLGELSAEAAGGYDIAVAKISVAALMNVRWLRHQLTVPEGIQRVILPGWCQGNLTELEEQFGVPFELGPKDLFDLPMHLCRKQRTPPDWSDYSIEILAEINHAPRLSLTDLLRQAEKFRRSGADVIDLGCIPGVRWDNIGEAVAALRREEFRLSVDSFDEYEVKTAVEHGAELVLSCNSGNIDWLAPLGVEVVAIPDDIHQVGTLQPIIERLEAEGTPFRIDPILEPIGFGFAASLHRYYQARSRWPLAPMMMGIGNLTELSEVDSAGMNLLLAAICEELQVHSVLTTEVINWARTAVAEFDFARRLAHHSVSRHVLPKHLDSRLVMLRDVRVHELGQSALEELAARLTDPNYRIFVERGEIHMMNRDGYWRGTDPFELFDRFSADRAPLAPAHAFYLGYELCKAVTALTLGKQYRQDQSLDWGMLTVAEISAHDRRREKTRHSAPERSE